MQRRVEAEILDTLSPHDRRARRSRRDLRRLNRFMRHAEIISRLLVTVGNRHLTQQIVELGAGDGTLLLRVAQRLAPTWPGMKVVLVDQHDLVSPETRDGFHALGWEVESLQADVFDWLRTDASNRNRIIVANLFLHHFSDQKLSELFHHVAARKNILVACEPHRAWLPLTVSRWLGLIGCNALTRHDAVISVRAGFTGNELSALWPNQVGWKLSERAAGWFSHGFLAQRFNA